MKLPEILNQNGKPFCSAYAVTGVANFILAERDDERRVDADALFRQSTMGSGGSTLGQILTRARAEGLPLIGGGKVRVDTYKRIVAQPSVIQAEMSMCKTPLVFTMLIPHKGFSDLVPSPGFVMEFPMASHSMAVTAYLGNERNFEIANSFGDRWKNNGYFKIPAMMMRPPWIIDVYSFTLAP